MNFVLLIKFGYIDLDNYFEYNFEECQCLLVEVGYFNGEGLFEIEYIILIGFYFKIKEYGEVIIVLMQEQGFNVVLNVMEVVVWNEWFYDCFGGGFGYMVDCGWFIGLLEFDLVLCMYFYLILKCICGIEDFEIDVVLDVECNVFLLEECKVLLQMNLMLMFVDKVLVLLLFILVLIYGMCVDLEGLFIYFDGQFDVFKVVMG